jgi:hypothetical protein
MDENYQIEYYLRSFQIEKGLDWVAPEQLSAAAVSF